MTFTAAEKRDAAERECQQRRKVYPKLIDAGKMSPRSADYQIRVMEAIAADYRRLAGGDLADGLTSKGEG